MEDCPQSWKLGQTFLDKTAPREAFFDFKFVNMQVSLKIPLIKV
jgi:hypothetical protein